MDLKLKKDEWFAAQMLCRVRKRKNIDRHELQSLQNAVKKGRDTVITDFEEVFQEMIEGKRAKMTSTTSVHYTADNTEDIEDDMDDLPEDDFTKEERETLHMGTPSEARRFQQVSQPFSQGRQSFNRRSFPRDCNLPSRQLRYDGNCCD